MALQTTASAPKAKKPFYKDLFFQVMLAVALGVIVGHYFPDFGVQMKPLGDAFINLIKMMIGPIIFCTVVSGVAGVGNMKQAGRVGIKALIYFEIVTTFALAFGMMAIWFYTPSPDLAQISVDTSELQRVTAKAASSVTSSTSGFLMGIIPHTLVSAFTEGQILQVLLVALFFAAGLTMMGEQGKPIVRGIELVATVVFNIVSLIIKLAPLGVFGAIAFSVSKFGVGALRDLGEVMLLFFIACISFAIVVLGSIMRFYCKLSLWKLIRYIREEMMISFGTASTESVLPRMIDKLTHLGCSRPVVGMVLPTGYSFNLDGTTLYLSMAALFVAKVAGVELTWGQEALIFGILLVTSKGAAAVYGAAFVVLAATLHTVQVIPEDKMAMGLALLFAIDRIMATGRVLTNLVGNSVATIVMAKSENALDYDRAKKLLDEA